MSGKYQARADCGSRPLREIASICERSARLVPLQARARGVPATSCPPARGRAPFGVLCLVRSFLHLVCGSKLETTVKVSSFWLGKGFSPLSPGTGSASTRARARASVGLGRLRALTSSMPGPSPRAVLADREACEHSRATHGLRSRPCEGCSASGDAFRRDARVSNHVSPRAMRTVCANCAHPARTVQAGVSQTALSVARKDLYEAWREHCLSGS